MGPPNITPKFLLNLVLWNRIWPLPYPTTTYAGKTILVTGSNTGLGLEAARHFVRLGAEKVILGVRNLEKGESAKRSIEESTLRLNVVEVWKLDLGTFAGTMELVEKMEALPRLDVAVLNAALVPSKWHESPDGWEETLQVNVLSTTLLALHVVKKQMWSARQYPGYTPRFVMLASDAHGMTRFVQKDEPDVLRLLSNKEYFEDPSNFWERYALSKLFIMYVTREIAKRVPMNGDEPEVIVNMVHPGFCQSELGRHSGVVYSIVVSILGRTSEVGSRTTLDGASRGKESHGQYLAFCQVTPPEPVITSDEGQKAQEKMWGEVIAVLEAKYPGLLKSTLGW